MHPFVHGVPHGTGIPSDHLRQARRRSASSWWRRAGHGLLAAYFLATAAQAQAQPAPPLGLRDAVLQAVAHDPRVLAARAQVDAARALGKQAQSALWPRAGLSTNYGRTSDDYSPFVLDQKTRRSEAFLRWNLFNGLQDRRQIEGARLDLIATEAEWLAALDEAAERLGSAYFELLRQQQLAVYAERRLVEVDALARRVARQVELGKGAEADAQLAAASRIDAELALQAVQSALGSAQTQLRVLLGDTSMRELRVEDELAPATDADRTLDAWQTQAQQRNGRWLAAAARALGARERIANVAPEYLPRVDMDLRKRLSDRSDPAVAGTTRRGWTVSLTYDVPLGGAPRARQDEVRARAEAAEAEVQVVRDTVAAEFSMAGQQARQALSAAPLLAQQRADWTAVVRASALQYDAGRRSLMGLIDQHERRYAVEQRTIDNAWQLATAQLRLHRLGGDLAEAFGLAGVERPGF